MEDARAQETQMNERKTTEKDYEVFTDAQFANLRTLNEAKNTLDEETRALVMGVETQMVLLAEKLSELSESGWSLRGQEFQETLPPVTVARITICCRGDKQKFSAEMYRLLDAMEFSVDLLKFVDGETVVKDCRHLFADTVELTFASLYHALRLLGESRVTVRAPKSFDPIRIVSSPKLKDERTFEERRTT